MRSLGVVTALLLTVPAFTGCLTDTATDRQDGRVVYTTFYPLQFFTQRLMGDEAEVRTLIPLGAEPHDFEPSPRDVATVTHARAFVYLGHGFEPWLDRLLESANAPSLALVNATAAVDLALPEAEHHEAHEEDEHEAEHHEAHEEDEHQDHDAHEEHETHEEDAHQSGHNETHADEDHEAEEAGHEEHDHDLGGMDPHVWLDPVLAQDVARAIAQGLKTAFPELNATLDANLANLTADLESLAAAYEAGLSDCEKESIITAHNAYGRLAERYGFDVVSVSGLSPEGEPSPRHVQHIVDFAKEHGIGILFQDALGSSRAIQAIADEVEGDIRILYPIEGLTKEQQAAGVTYFDLQEHNLRELREALACA